MKKRSLTSSIVTHFFLILFTLGTLYPAIMVVKKAFSPGQHFDMDLNPIPEKVTLENFKGVVSAKDSKGKPVFWRQLLNSVIVSLLTTILGVFLSCTAAYAFSRFKFPGRSAGMLAFLVSQMFPGTLMIIPIYIIMSKMELLGNILGLVLVYSTTAIPFCVWMLKGYFDTIPKELEEAAIIDGASRFTVFWKVILPLAKPAVAVTALFSFMTAWNEFILAATFMNKESSYTLPVVLWRYAGEHDVAWGFFAAGSIITALPVIGLFFLLQKNLVSGLTAGGVKG